VNSSGVLSLVNNPTLSGGTANGVLFLNGSKVATSGNAFVFDGTNVGIGTASPDANFKLDVQAATGRIKLTSTTGTNSVVYQANNTGGTLNVGIDSSTGGSLFGVGAYAAGVWYSGNYPLVFGVNNAEGFRLTSSTLYTASGINVGIGTSSPAYKLDVNTGQIRANESTTGSGDGGLIAGTVGANGNAGVLFQTNGASRWNLTTLGTNGASLRIYNYALASTVATFDSSGNLGIGTTSTGFNSAGLPLVVGSGSGNTGMTIFSGAGSNGSIHFADTVTTGADSYRGIITYSHSNNSMAFYTDATVRATIDSSGNLGLGVVPSAWTSSAFQLGSGFAAWSTAVTNARIFANTYYDGTYKFLGNGRATQYEQDGYHAWYVSTTSNSSGAGAGPISFTQAMTLDADGDLGVGTTSPSYRFQAVRSGDGITAGISGGTYGIRFDNGGTFSSGASTIHGVDSTLVGSYQQLNLNGSVLTFQTGATERARITSGGYSKFSNDGTYASSTGAYHEFHSSDAAQPILYLTATSGSYTGQTIYINNTRAASSAYKFYSANANAVEQFYVRGDGVLYAQNTTIQSLSDGRLKENIRNATEGLDVINALRPIRYDWKTGFGNDRKNQLGFVAQEVEAVFPDAVSEWSKTEGDEEPYKTVGPGALIPVLVKAIQEQQAMIKSLEAKVAALEIH
jgi:hypothetical protein